ncbi:protein lin-54 homolog isoform X3 [Nymphalis io]|uniref:protein lin-54 homolog isoform X3 n=1 Tax=Inachis io TaxID=171585 RepID=UPI002166DE4E|nr:protein lin-54 homolog isoform X3 [Nymphalis io]
MDHNLDDSLNLESDMGVDFEHSEDTVVNQADMVLEQHTSQVENIPMEFAHNEDHSMLMDTGSEEIIVSDFMGDQFSLQEYSVQSDQTTGLTTTVESNQQHMLSTQGDTMIDLAFQPQMVTVKKEPVQRKIIAVKTMSPMRTSTTVRRNETAVLTTAPRQVAIAPKPPKLVAKTYTANKQLAIAPKPVTLVANRSNSLVKKVSIGNVQSNTKGNTVLTQIGKQFQIMVPSSTQKIKLVPSSGMNTVQYVRSDSDQGQLIPAKAASGSQTKPVITRFISMQGGAAPAEGESPRYVAVPHGALPLALANKMLLATPSKQGVKIAKKQEIISLKSPTPKLMPAPALNVPSSTGTKQKVVISANPMQNVILKPSAPPKTAQVKDNVVESQRSQLHQINVPGKGIQYIRVVTNSSKPPPQKPVLSLPPRTFMLSDGNLIQMSAEKIASSLVATGNTNTLPKVAPKPPRKLVRIAPVVKTAAVTQAGRSSQSLLAPLSPPSPPLAASPASPPSPASSASPSPPASPVPSQDEDSKSELRALIEKAVAEGNVNEVEVEFNRPSPSLENSTDAVGRHDASGRSDEHPLIVIPSNYDDSEIVVSEGQNTLDNSQRSDSMINIEGDSANTYQSPNTPALSETDIAATDLGLRPRKACNCTKSQCLKLYCDCFANGEFCNRCNCNNCHNNLENEELRQKAIRGCLDRNPNAFRPKIGKAKIGGPEMIRRHNKGCNCKRSGCLKNYCECYEAKIACSSICKCVGCRNVEETLERARRRDPARAAPARPAPHYRPPPQAEAKQPCSFMTTEVIEAVCQCLIAAAVDNKDDEERQEADPMRDVIDEFARCLQDIISAAHQSAPLAFVDEGPA